MKEIKLIRVAEGKDSTLGHLYLGGFFCCYTLEDRIRAEKIHGRTAIPAGQYSLALNTWGGMNGRYKNLFGAMHRGMLEVKGIPSFSLVYLHIGNTHADTAGCLLLGDHYQHHQGEYRLLHSMGAYKRVYPQLLAELDRGNDQIRIEERRES